VPVHQRLPEVMPASVVQARPYPHREGAAVAVRRPAEKLVVIIRATATRLS